MPTAIASPPPRRSSGRPKGADSARGLIAAMDGLQLQWLSDPGYTDIAADFATLLEAVRYP